jgi:hypothetical protein
MEKTFTPNYIKCPDCGNILELSFKDKACPNPLCGFKFEGLDAYLDKSDNELRKLLLGAYKAKESQEYKLVITAIKHNIGNYLAHFVECDWGAHYNTLFDDFILNFFDDLNILKTVLKSEVIKEKENVVISKNGYKMFWELYCCLKKVNNGDIRNFLIKEFPGLHRRHYKEWFEKYKKTKKDKIEKIANKAKLF